MAVSQALTVTQSSQSIANNTSTIRIKWTSTQSGASYNNYTKTAYYYVSVNGGAETKYSVTYTLPKGATKTIVDTTLVVAHNSAGECSVKVRTYMETGISAGTVQKSTTLTLTTIPRISTLTTTDGRLGKEHYFNVTKQSNNFTHTITYVCGSQSGTICTKSTETQIKATLPLSLAKENTAGLEVTIVFTITTYNGSTKIGSKNYTKTFSFYDGMHPTCSVVVTDAMGYEAKYGAYVQGKSKMKIVVTASGVYNATIKSYKIMADDKTYTSANTTTGVIAKDGTLPISVTVTDSRGMTASAKVEINVLEYTPPQVSELVAYRCNSNTAKNPSGKYLAVNFDAVVTSLNNKNSAKYTLEYKKTTDEKYIQEDLNALDDVFVIYGASSVFDAEQGSSYDIRISVADDFGITYKTVIGASAKKFWSVFAQGLGLALGKFAELEGVFDIAFKTRFMGGILHPVLEPETDLDDIRTPNTYVGANVSTYNYGNCPLTSGTFSLEVIGMGEEGQVKQRLTYCHKTASRAWERIYHKTDDVMSWGEWVCVSDFDGQLLWEGAWFMNGDQIINLPEKISEQCTGIELVFALYEGALPTNNAWHLNHFFVSKKSVALKEGYGNSFFMTRGGFDHVAAKYLHIYDDKIIGYQSNSATGTKNGITFANNKFVLVYVIGV